MLSGIVPEDCVQQDLFASTDSRKEVLSVITDKINDKYGRGSLFLASEGTKKEWQTKRQYLSPCYTTRWQDILHIKN